MNGKMLQNIEKKQETIEICGATIPNLNITIPPKWFYSESSISKSLL